MNASTVAGVLALLCVPLFPLACSGDDGSSGDEDADGTGGTFTGNGGSPASGSGGSSSGTCPIIMPNESSSCYGTGASCRYGTTVCTCSGGWTCVRNASGTGGGNTGGSNGETGGASGDSGGMPGETGGFGTGGSWGGDCPWRAPNPGDDCASVGLECDYWREACVCTDTGWQCGDPGGTGGDPATGGTGNAGEPGTGGVGPTGGIGPTGGVATGGTSEGGTGPAGAPGTGGDAGGAGPSTAGAGPSETGGAGPGGAAGAAAFE